MAANRSRRAFGPPLLRQLAGDRLGLGAAAQSKRSRELTPRTRTADRVVQSICPYCAVGCGQKVYVKDERVVQIEGDPDSPISRGRLCPSTSRPPACATPAPARCWPRSAGPAAAGSGAARARR